MSRHQFHVVTSFLPPVGFAGRDAKIQVATSHTATHVATSKMMSRPQAQPSQVVTSKPGRDQPLFPPQNALVVTPKSLVATPDLLSAIQLGRDVHFWSRPQADKSRSRPQSHVATSKRFPRSQHEFHVTTQDP